MDKVDLMLIEVEYGELPILRDAQATITKFRPTIMVEGGDIGRQANNSTSPCIEILEKKCLLFLWYVKGAIKQLNPQQESFKAWQNILCVHSSKIERYSLAQR